MIYIIKRFYQSILVMVSVSVIAFIMFRYVGDPINAIVGIETSLADRETLRDQLGLNDSIYEQFFRFLINTAQGDFGISYQHKMPVTALIVERIPATLELTLISGIISISLGILMGVYSAIKQGSLGATVVNIISLCGVSVPIFLLGLLLMLVFSIHLQWLPAFGRPGVTDLGFWQTSFLSIEGLKGLILPSITLVLYQLTLIMRLVRSSMLEIMQENFIRFCKARGIKNRSLYFRHALKNAMVPLITVIGLQLGSTIVFSIITETVFQWPGMGLLFIQAVQNADIPVMSAYLILVALTFVFINFVVDLLYFVIDPRLRKVN